MPINKPHIKIVLTGGHAGSTAYALIQQLKTKKDLKEIHFIGVNQAMEGKSQNTLESEFLPGKGVYFHAISMGRIQRVFTRFTIPSLFKIPLGFVQSFFLIRKINPQLILSFGGFAAYPVIIAGWIFRIPIIIHEQTSAAGRANKYSSFFATKIALSRSSSTSYFPKEKSVITGNPLVGEILKVGYKKNPGNPPTIFITGGSRGSVPINDSVSEVLRDLLKVFKVVHQTGKLQYQKFISIRNSLNDVEKSHYLVYDVVSPSVWVDLLEDSDIVLTRAGANAVSQIVFAKRPAIFVPLPFAYENEQFKNAMFAQDFGVGTVLLQEDLNRMNLLRVIHSTYKNWDKIVKGVKNKVSPDKNASQQLSDLVFQTIDEKNKK